MDNLNFKNSYLNSFQYFRYILILKMFDNVVSGNNFADSKPFENSIHDTTAGGAKS